MDINGLSGDLTLDDVKVVTTIQGGDKGAQFGFDLLVTQTSLWVSEPAYGNLRLEQKAATGRVYEWKLGQDFPTRVVRDRVASSSRCFYGKEVRGRFGQVLGQGDFDADGLTDVVVTSSHSSSGAASAGRVNIFYSF